MKRDIVGEASKVTAYVLVASVLGCTAWIVMKLVTWLASLQ